VAPSVRLVNERTDELGELYVEAVAAFQEVALLTTNESAKLDDVLRLAGQRLCELLGVSRCSVYLRREDGLFQGQVGYCVGRGSIDTGVSRLVAGIENDLFTSEVVRTAAPVLIENASHDPRPIQSTMRKWGIQAMLGVPLVVDNEVIGIIFVDNEGVHHDYTSRDVGLAQAFAGLSALAVFQTWLYQRLESRTKIIDRQRQVLEKSEAIHNLVTQAVLAGADIDAILRLLSDQLGKPIVLYGPTRRVVSWSAPERLGVTECPGLTPETVSLPWVRQAFNQLDSGPSSVVLRPTPETRCRRLLVRMAADSQCAGYLELCEIGCRFSDVDAKALEQAALAISLKLLSSRHEAEVRRQQRDEFYADLLYGRRDPTVLRERAKSFGFDIDERYVVVRLQYHEGEAATLPSRPVQRIGALLVSRIESVEKCVSITGLPGADFALLQVAEPDPESQGSRVAVELERHFTELADNHGIRYAIVSEECTDLEHFPVATDRLTEIFRLLKETSSDSRVVFARDVELLRMIMHREGIHGVLRQANELMAPLVKYDAVNNASLVETLTAFMQCQAQIRSTALLLDVHENTVRYRLHRIRELSAVEPERLDGLLLVAVALQVQSLFAASESQLGPRASQAELAAPPPAVSEALLPQPLVP
jgi:sugar diacid utilization regulator